MNLLDGESLALFSAQRSQVIILCQNNRVIWLPVRKQNNVKLVDWYIPPQWEIPFWNLLNKSSESPFRPPALRLGASTLPRHGPKTRQTSRNTPHISETVITRKHSTMRPFPIQIDSILSHIKHMHHSKFYREKTRVDHRGSTVR